MARTDTDSWDLASSVGATATMVAAARAIASTEPNALIDDPYAADLVRKVGLEFFTKLVDGDIALDGDDAAAAGLMVSMMAVRTRFFDDFFCDAAGAGIRQSVILAAGLDSRAYRLGWPAGTVVYEIDQPRVIEAKTAAMAEIGASPTAERRTVAVDLRDDWPAALRAAGFDAATPTAWIAEGLLVYLPPEAQDRLFDNITALSARGSRLATEYHPDITSTLRGRGQAMSERWRDHGFDVDLSDLWYGGDRNAADEYLAGHGWQVSTRPRPEVFAAYGRTFPDLTLTGDDNAAMRQSVAITATRS
ncbi:class I SAM-dependent methyltransferase [Mycolicibacterium smegmatis]|uniref:Putative S-adenosyl-L-methionine-dependent methyltransferase MSMEG_1481/MSMEI_1445 n=3 Tax=Mycolicibacterium smegmatis TaxID=1772 RepID=Y1481_MYCS2|nr:class I SAM-dependent methyltransferase [Mycolicibacterium smegmatis]A0QSH5.1 RecName: Full=Putative S-adenosyl-L-methionine-dependent methyltransferase MSMEG_1481/MSMEI_1445 [Mycolicibacterium smegmatis MC2 155]ABK73326.1 methyltransferase [Mycolicibacterium smegmatis MC2 155]AFP37918.1 O-methyltransferase [Mycolicibacterium smegmatis MC2 155]AIU06716.1 SAM-dependent methyltransferase [Mycolicibacterium smegmatis MC2 155]AIU13341.1 SAM-dependent methyltransferase [Mycolicibacterium smegmat